MMPARVALALQADGWWLRSMMPWVKRSAMPESVTDRPATAIEYVFLLTRSGDTTFWQHRDGGGTGTRPAPDYRWIHKDTGEEVTTPPEGWNLAAEKTWKRVNLWRGRDYFWDGEAVRQDCSGGGHGGSPGNRGKKSEMLGQQAGGNLGDWDDAKGRNFRNSDLFYASLEPPHGLISGEDGEPLALDVNPAGYSESHFATFPPKLIEPLIKAATSEKGCCAECGAPWVRDVDATEEYKEKLGKGSMYRYAKDGPAGRSILTGGESNKSTKAEYRTLGWSPSCGCDPLPDIGISPRAAAVPCTVLDPFGGAGTTGLVADRLGRNAILIELNPDYADMARQRIHKDAPLFAEVT